MVASRPLTCEPFKIKLAGYKFMFADGRYQKFCVDPVKNRKLNYLFSAGMLQLWNFNVDEATGCLTNILTSIGLEDLDVAAAADMSEDTVASAVLTSWAIAFAGGVNYNMPYLPDFMAESVAEYASFASTLCEELPKSDKYVPLRSLVDAVQHRSEYDCDIDLQNTRFRKAMEIIYNGGGMGPDIGCIYAQSIMQLRPWKLWERTDAGEVIEETMLLRTVLERELELAPKHPGLCHCYIHLMELSPTPEKALPACNILREEYIDMGHLLHMASHIDVQLGSYEYAAKTNLKAIDADLRLREYLGSFDNYQGYLLHNYHMVVWTAMLDADFETAMQAAIDIQKYTSIKQVRDYADYLEGVFTDTWHVLVRFGKWQEIIDKSMPEEPELMLMTTAIAHYCKGLAFAVVGQMSDADEHLELFQAAAVKVPETRIIHNVSCRDILRVAECMITGEIAYRYGRFEEAFDLLRTGVDREINLPYDEPWGWMQPVSHALGGLLLEQHRIEEAEVVFRADLKRYPKNVWSLAGLASVLKLDATRADEYRKTLEMKEKASGRCDNPIEKTCFCQGYPIVSRCCGIDQNRNRVDSDLRNSFSKSIVQES